VLAGAVQLVAPLATFGDARFKMPLYPTLAVCAAVALATLWDRRGAKPVPGTGSPSADRDEDTGRSPAQPSPASA
jgi:hypothetical protein